MRVSPIPSAAVNVQDLALGQLATAFALLRLPRMPELKQARGALDGFKPSLIDPETGANGLRPAIALA